jgi:hypothetical protein
VDLQLVGRFARRVGVSAAASLISAAATYEDAKIRTHFYDMLQSLGDDVGGVVAAKIPEVSPATQRELLALLGRLSTLPAGFSPNDYVLNPEPLVRREALRLLLRDPSLRDGAAMTALFDNDDRVVFVGLTAAQEKYPPNAIDLIKHRVDRGELDSQLRTMGIRIVAQQRTSGTLDWLLGHVVGETRWGRRPKLRPSTPEMLAALSMIAAGWADDPAAAPAIKLAEQSKDSEVRAKVTRKRSAEAQGSKPT